jgi:hypothetical protein
MGAWFALNVQLARKSFWEYPMELLVDVGLVEAHFVCLEIVLILALGRCMVCAECTMGIEMFSATTNGVPR